jgi:hypothetical protein
MGYVYLIVQTGNDGQETYKIGMTKNEPEARLKQLQTGNSNKISLLKSYKTKNYRKVEKSMHLKYSSYKTEADNEWFQLENNHVINFMEDCKKADEIIQFLLENNEFYK